jgi:hypothetical protein
MDIHESVDKHIHTLSVRHTRLQKSLKETADKIEELLDGQNYSLIATEAGKLESIAYELAGVNHELDFAANLYYALTSQASNQEDQ